MDQKAIVKELFKLQDKTYAVFNSKLIPTVDSDRVIGVRTPELKNFAKTLAKDKNKDLFLQSLPHQYFEENQLRWRQGPVHVRTLVRCMGSEYRVSKYMKMI